ncbi:MAG: hypothetical protein BMS9Abin09_0452 [Gammaproteobacteria bacterium]|nr:MAG: hypothetical protein BMS9Abin09_0452 [Gammaproteobacteria bacterium]
MKDKPAFFDDLSTSDIEHIKANAVERRFRKDDLVFSQGDLDNSFYIIQQGSVSVFYEANGEKKPLCRLESGDYFGEMGIVNQDKRSASVSVLEDSILLCLDKDKFLSLTKSNPVLANKINHILAQRNEELILRESLSDAIGIRSNNLYVSIKGDPSLRETALFRERYESPVDRILDKLQPNLQGLLLNRCIFQLVVNFNSGEIRVRSVFDPFREKVHTADKLVDRAYIDRHFTNMPYKEKLRLVADTYGFISGRPQFNSLPEQWKSIFQKSISRWEPLSMKEIESIMSKLIELRNVPSFYLRNISINIIQDAIRLQFNCDGTHIVSSEDYQQFIEDNF